MDPHNSRPSQSALSPRRQRRRRTSRPIPFPAESDPLPHDWAGFVEGCLLRLAGAAAAGRC